MSNPIVVYRVQAADGRGPFRPGFSRKWSDAHGPLRPPTWLEEFGTAPLHEIPDGWHAGSAVRTPEALAEWFTHDEMVRLRLLGYRAVRMTVDRILRESPSQVLFVRAKPLHWEVEELPR